MRTAIEGFVLCCVLTQLFGCSDVNIARTSGEYEIDFASSSVPKNLIIKNLQLTLNSDGSFSIKGKYNGIKHETEGTWTMIRDTISFKYQGAGKQPDFITEKVITSNDKLVVEMTILNHPVRSVLVKEELPAWTISIFGLIILAFVMWMYKKRDSPQVTFEGGSPGFVTIITIISGLSLIDVGIWGSFRPEIVVWFGEIAALIGDIKYVGFLVLIAIGLIITRISEPQSMKIIWLILGLAAIALLIWLYYRYGVELEAESGL